MKEKLARLRAFPDVHRRLADILGSLTFFCVLVGLDGGLRLMFPGAGITSAFSSIPWVFTLAWAVMLSFLVRLLPPPAQRVATAVLGALASILFLVNALMLRAKGNFFSFSSLIFAGDGFKFLDASYLRVRMLVWVAVLM